MLQMSPTKKGVGVTIWGDYGDLKALDELFTDCMVIARSHADEELNKMLGVMSYDIRHAYSGHREIEEFTYYDKQTVQYYGFKVDWITLLFTISCIRYSLSHKPSTDLMQSEIYLLESLTKTAIQRYDPSSYTEILRFFGGCRPANIEIVYFMQQYAVKYFFESKQKGRRRFRLIPGIIYKCLYSNTELHDELLKQYKKLIEEGVDTNTLVPEYTDIPLEDY